MEVSAHWSLSITRKPKGAVPIQAVRGLLRILSERTLEQFTEYSDDSLLPGGYICEWESTGYGAYDETVNCLDAFACGYPGLYFDLHYRDPHRGNNIHILAHGGDTEEIDSCCE